MRKIITALHISADSSVTDNWIVHWWRTRRGHLERHGAHWRGEAIKRIIRVTLGCWLVAVLALGAAGAFIVPAGTAPIPILIGATVPLLVFLGAYRSSAVFREFILSIDLLPITAIQAWRAGGLGFLALYAHGILPGVFAWPAGLGDIAIGITAPWVVLALVRQPGFSHSRAFVVWNLLGILDLVVAVSLGALSSVSAWGVARGVTTSPMALLPLVLIPAYLVPLFVMLHLTSLSQARHVESSEKARTT